ncbi:oncostatin-M-specific receptor subunit beta-like [Eudromia elegans]
MWDTGALVSLPALRGGDGRWAGREGGSQACASASGSWSGKQEQAALPGAGRKFLSRSSRQRCLRHRGPARRGATLPTAATVTTADAEIHTQANSTLVLVQSRPCRIDYSPIATVSSCCQRRGSQNTPNLLRTKFAGFRVRESLVFPVTYLRVSKDLPLQRLQVEWDVGKSAHDAELPMSFEIQVNRMEENTTVWTELYNVTLDKSGKPLHWNWDSDLPLECMSHSVRIRSKAEASKSWSQWSPWETIPGLDASNYSQPQIFPDEKIIEEGSDITLCCIGRKGQIITEFFSLPAVHNFSRTHTQTGLLTAKNVAHQKTSHVSVFCQESGGKGNHYNQTVFFVGNYLTALSQQLGSGFAQKLIPCTVHCTEECSCSWDINHQRVYNIMLTVENPLGKKTATDAFDVTHRIQPSAPSKLFGHCSDTEIMLSWKQQNKGIKLICETEVLHPDGKAEWHNSSSTYLQHASITLGGLQPYTQYTCRVRCGAAQHFWRWSEWSNAQTFRTKEASPSGKLDIWRQITPVLGGRNVTLFWKPTPSFRANGRSISYEVTWGKVEGNSKPEHISISSVYNSTRIFIDNNPYKISVVAKNNVNYSRPSVMVIPGATGNSNLKEDQVIGADDGIFLSWEPSNKYDGYVVDWCNFPELQPCDLQWQRFGPHNSSALISSALFVPGVRYNFHIYGSAANTVSLLEKKTGYLKELPPTLDPPVKKIHLTFHAVTLSWDSYPTTASQPGFVRGYHVYVSPMQEDCSLKESKKHVLPDGSVLCKYTIENPEEKRYTVKHLMPNTKYKVVVKAYTGGGESPIASFIYIETPFDCKKAMQAECKLKAIWEYFHFVREINVQNQIGSEKVLKINDCEPDAIAVATDSAAQMSPLCSQASTPGEDKTDVPSSSWTCPTPNGERDFASTPKPMTYTLFENLAYLSHIAVESNPYQSVETLEPDKPQLPAVLYQPQHYLDISHEGAASSLGGAAGRKASLKYVSQTGVHCLGRQL